MVWAPRLHGEPEGPTSITGTARFVPATFYIASLPFQDALQIGGSRSPLGSRSVTTPWPLALTGHGLAPGGGGRQAGLLPADLGDRAARARSSRPGHDIEGPGESMLTVEDLELGPRGRGNRAGTPRLVGSAASRTAQGPQIRPARLF